VILSSQCGSSRITFAKAESGAEQIAAVIEAANPDVVALQEAVDPAVVKRVAAVAGFHYWGSRLAHSTGFLSRIPVMHHAWHHPPRTRHALLEIELAEGLPRVFVLHLRAWFSNWSERQRARELGGLLDGIRARQASEERDSAFHILAGDFNALAPGERLDPSHMPAWIRGMIWLGGRDIARSTIELMRTEGYVDAWRILHMEEAGQSEHPGYTFPVWDPHVRLDYVFTPAQYASHFTACEVRRTPEAVLTASDHFPLLVEITSS
jgi:endonuclease/exonuclease/phosphatase family metal-dependent hydrolase